MKHKPQLIDWQILLQLQSRSPQSGRLTALLHVIMNEWLYPLTARFWISVGVVFLQCCLVVTWLMPRQTAAVSAHQFTARSVYTIQPYSSLQRDLIWSHSFNNYCTSNKLLLYSLRGEGNQCHQPSLCELKSVVLPWCLWMTVYLVSSAPVSYTHLTLPTTRSV